jgi:cytochrome c551/c552
MEMMTKMFYYRHPRFDGGFLCEDVSWCVDPLVKPEDERGRVVVLPRRERMGLMKGVIAGIVLTASLLAAETENAEGELEKACLSCHKEQQIPSGLIYKRYLMKYSTSERIENAMFSYLKDPQKSHSIMPPQFFLKFPMKPRMDIDDVTLRSEIRRYIQKFDLKKRLILDKSSS